MDEHKAISDGERDSEATTAGSMPDTLFEIIFYSTATRRIIRPNAIFLSTFGYTDTDIKEKSIDVLFADPNDFERLKQTATENSFGKEIFAFRKADGSQFSGVAQCRCQTDESDNRIIRWSVIDVSSLNTDTILRQKNEQLAKVSRQMEQFLYSTSHDLRAPVTSILGLINLMQMECREKTALQYASKIEATTLKLDHIIKDILSFSRTTYQHISSERIDFDSTLWKIINLHKTTAQVHNIDFEVNVMGQPPFFGDLYRIEVILENIIRNAIQFHDIHKLKPFVKVNVQVSNSKVAIECIDNGIGIGKPYLPEIFTMFYKASSVSKGAGLGLFIVKETLEKLAGTIRIESEIGFGTMARVTIPNGKKGKLIGRKMQLMQGSDCSNEHCLTNTKNTLTVLINRHDYEKESDRKRK